MSRVLGKRGIDKCLVSECEKFAKTRGVCSDHYYQWYNDIDRKIPLYDAHSNKITEQTNFNRKFCRKHYGTENDKRFIYVPTEECEYPGCSELTKKPRDKQYITNLNLEYHEPIVSTTLNGKILFINIDFGSKQYNLPLHNKITKERAIRWGTDIANLGLDNINNLNFDRVYVYELKDSSKKRAKKHKLEFAISIYDIIIPKYCPVLGIELLKSNSKFGCRNSPSLDRIDNTKGYITGNIQILSNRANTVKSDLNKEEMRMVGKWMLNIGT